MLNEIIVGLSLVVGQTGRSSRVHVIPPSDAPAQSAPLLPATWQQAPDAPAEGEGKNGNGNDNGNGDKEPHSAENGFHDFLKPKRETAGFFYRLYKAYYEEFFPPPSNGQETPEQLRRALPSPFDAPPFPNSEWQGYPLIGVPRPDPGQYPVMKAIYGADNELSEWIKNSKIQFTGWVAASGNWSTAKNSNTPDAYWIVPNRFELEQFCLKLERVPDTVQTDHIDWGFRIVSLYGMDYRYTMSGGWGSDQLFKHNLLYGWDPVEVYGNVYIPGFLGGTDVRVGRWIACPDIETQYTLDNYIPSHSILFTYDTYTQTGVMLSQKLNDQWTVQAAIEAGTDMAPWYRGATPTGAFGVRWVSKDNNDAVYAWLNEINDAKFRHFEQYGQPLGHDNFNYFVATWQHRWNKDILTKTEGYYMWQRDAEVGGSPSAGPVKSFGGGGGDGTLIPGYTQTYGIVNYNMFAFTKNDYFTIRNEWWKDEAGMRSGFRGVYTSHCISLSHYFNDVFVVRPEVGY
jgi:hypothetical protein